MATYQVRYDRASRAYDVWMWERLPDRTRHEEQVARLFRRETDAYQWINAHITKGDKVYSTQH